MPTMFFKISRFQRNTFLLLDWLRSSIFDVSFYSNYVLPFQRNILFYSDTRCLIATLSRLSVSNRKQHFLKVFLPLYLTFLYFFCLRYFFVNILVYSLFWEYAYFPQPFLIFFLSLSLFTTKVCNSTFRLRGERFNPLRHQRGQQWRWIRWFLFVNTAEDTNASRPDECFTHLKIDFIVVYAVSAIFRPYNGGAFEDKLDQNTI